MQDALWKMPAAAQAEAVRSAEISGVELVDTHLDRIGEVNPKVNPVTQLLAERAREAAAQMDRRRAAGDMLGPLAGVVPADARPGLHRAAGRAGAGVA